MFSFKLVNFANKTCLLLNPLKGFLAYIWGYFFPFQWSMWIRCLIFQQIFWPIFHEDLFIFSNFSFPCSSGIYPAAISTYHYHASRLWRSSAVWDLQGWILIANLSHMTISWWWYNDLYRLACMYPRDRTMAP